MAFTQDKAERATEEILVKEFQEGNLEAYDQIAERYQKKIYGLSFNLCRNQMDAQDVTQEVLLTLYRKINTFQGKSAFSSWVYRITLNATYMKLRSKKKEPHVSLDDLMPSFNGSAGNLPDAVEVTWSWSRKATLPVFLFPTTRRLPRGPPRSETRSRSRGSGPSPAVTSSRA